MPSERFSAYTKRARQSRHGYGEPRHDRRSEMRHYPWVIRGERKEEIEKAAQLRAALNGLFPQYRGGLDMASLASGLDIGAQAGLKRNLEFTAGGRAHRISTGSYTKA